VAVIVEHHSVVAAPERFDDRADNLDCLFLDSDTRPPASAASLAVVGTPLAGSSVATGQMDTIHTIMKTTAFTEVDADHNCKAKVPAS
jgi:hypothetical protein